MLEEHDGREHKYLVLILKEDDRREFINRSNDSV